MFPNMDGRAQVKTEGDECAITIPENAVAAGGSALPSLPDFKSASRWHEPGQHSGSARSETKDVSIMQPVLVNVAAPKFTGRSSCEVYRAQFELLADAAGWSRHVRAVQLALALTEEAAECLLPLSPTERMDYAVLTAALQRRFGQLGLRDSLRGEFKARMRLPGEPLRNLAHEIERMGRRAYEDMPRPIQDELICDQFIHALSPADLRLHVRLAHPATLWEAL